MFPPLRIPVEVPRQCAGVVGNRTASLGIGSTGETNQMSASQRRDEPPPAGRKAVVASLLAATERLSTTGQPSSFTVRQIAAEAGVTTSLLYFYFKSKDDIILATVGSMSAEIDAEVSKETDIGAMVSTVNRILASRPAFPRLLAWLVLERRTSGELSDYPFLGRLSTIFSQRGSVDPSSDAGAVVTTLLGVALFREATNVALGRSPDDERLIQTLDLTRLTSADDATAIPADGPPPG